MRVSAEELADTHNRRYSRSHRPDPLVTSSQERRQSWWQRPMEPEHLQGRKSSRLWFCFVCSASNSERRELEVFTRLMLRRVVAFFSHRIGRNQCELTPAPRDRGISCTRPPLLPSRMRTWFVVWFAPIRCPMPSRRQKLRDTTRRYLAVLFGSRSGRVKEMHCDRSKGRWSKPFRPFLCPAAELSSICLAIFS